MVDTSIFLQSSQHRGPQVCVLGGFSYKTDSRTEKSTNFVGEKI